MLYFKSRLARPCLEKHNNGQENYGAVYREKGPSLGGLALFAEISPSGLLQYKILLRLYQRRASLPRRDLNIQYPRSRLGGLEIFHVNAILGGGGG